MILTDTNIPLRSHPSDPHYELTNSALAKLRQRNESLCIAPQNLIEFWAVATRPRTENGLGMDVFTAATEIGKLLQLFHLLPYTPQVVETWRQIVVAQGISGKQTHDAHLAAIMQVHAVSVILTFNSGHFERFPTSRLSILPRCKRADCPCC